MKKLEGKWNGILYEGGFDNFSVNGSCNMEREVLYRNNPDIESEKRLNMAYLLLKNPKMIETIQEKSAYFFHGTNVNALPSILKYGINSVDTSKEKYIDIITGEEWSRINGKRNFVSLTDCIDAALLYANLEMKDKKSINTLLNFGVVIGISLKDMKEIKTCPVRSDISELGICENVPLDYIKFLAVPNDKIEFVKKMVGEKDIEVVSMDIKDRFFNNNCREKLNILEPKTEKIEQTKSSYPTYSKNDVEKIVNTRKISQIKKIFNNLKAKIHMHNKETNDKTISERS